MTEMRKITNEASTWIGERNFLRSKEIMNSTEVQFLAVVLIAIAIIPLAAISSVAIASP